MKKSIGGLALLLRVGLFLSLACVRGDWVEPEVHIARDESGVRISFTDTLQVADTAAGPWTTLGGVTSPYIPPPGTELKFYRARRVLSIFFSQTPIDLTITGPLQTHFELADAGIPDGIFPPVREVPWFDATVALAGQEVPVTLRVRGSSSLQECPFPKLKFKVSRSNREGTPFYDAREVKIATHCAEGGRGPIGRLREQTAVYREALAYETMAALGFVSPRVRRALIEYRDTSPAGTEGEHGWVLTRQGMIFDDPEVVAEGMGGHALDDEEIAVLSNANFDPQLVTDLHFLQALLGNWDYVLSAGGEGSWNIEVIAMPDGKLIPMAGDFDLASFVTEEVRLSAPWDYYPELEEIDRQARWQLEEIEKWMGSERFAKSRDLFVAGRQTLETIIEHAVVDEIGRVNAARHLAAFYGALEGFKSR